MKKTLLLISLLSISALAENESPQLFFGVKGGYQWSLDDSYHHSAPNGSIWGIYGGIQFTPSWRWDLGYQYHDDLTADVTSVTLKAWMIESALRYDWYLQDKLSLYGRLGIAYWNMEKTQPLISQLDAKGFSPLGELGVRYNFTERLNLSAGYQYIHRIGKSNTGEYDSYAALVSLDYSFGRALESQSIATDSGVESTSVFQDEMIKSWSQFPVRHFPTKTIGVRFGFDTTRLNRAVLESLAEVAVVLNSHRQARAIIVGHADSSGSKAYNQKLSELRAQSVVEQLIEFGVMAKQLEWRGEGETHPTGDNTTAEGRAKNRRVEVTIPKFQF